MSSSNRSCDFGIERLVEPPLECLARELAVAVIHDELIDRFLAQSVDRAVLWCHWHRSPSPRAAARGSGQE